MPSLQFDAPRTYDAATKRTIARELGEAYARIMLTTADLVTVAVHDLGEGAVWRCTDDDPGEAALVMCDVRSGRTSATRAELAEAIIAVCATHGDLRREQIKVEFTQHSGDDMYHPHLGGFNHDWTGDETGDGRTRTVRAVEAIVNLHTDDVERARDFFRLLGLTEEPMNQGWVARFVSPDSGASVQVVTRDASAPEDSVMTIKVDDVDAAYDESRRRGYEIVHPITDEPWGVRRFFVRSPDGHVVNVAGHI